MNAIKLSTQIQTGRSNRLSVKLNPQALGLPWKAQDVIRVLSYRDDGAIILKRVANKSPKTIAHKLTKTGGGSFDNDLGLFITHRPNRFAGDFTAVSSMPVRYRMVGKNKSMIKIYLPQEIFA